MNTRFRPRGRTYPVLNAFVIESGGSTKTISGTSIAVTAAQRGYKGVLFDLDANLSATLILGYTREDLANMKTIYHLFRGEATLDEVAVPARYVSGENPDGSPQFTEVENLLLVPGSPEMANADTDIATDSDRNDWFMEVLDSYEGEDEIFYFDFPASYGSLVYSVLRMLDDDDNVIASVRADPKDIKNIPYLLDELNRVRERNKKKRAVPGRPTLKHVLLTATNTPSYTEGSARRATETAEELYGNRLLPYVRYSGNAKLIYEDEVPIPILMPNSHPAEDYRKVCTALGLK